jgi:hypothetical protein
VKYNQRFFVFGCFFLNFAINLAPVGGFSSNFETLNDHLNWNQRDSQFPEKLRKN